MSQLDSSYRQHFEVSPVGQYEGDLHDFQITKDGTALVTMYETIPADLTSIGGPVQGWITDSMFQELDIATGRLIFEWRASRHVPINGTFHEGSGNANGEDRTQAFDYFHINSVDKDHNGDYLVSARHTHSVTCIDRNSGGIRWTLGGKLNEFQDMSDGAATLFA